MKTEGMRLYHVYSLHFLQREMSCCGIEAQNESGNLKTEQKYGVTLTGKLEYMVSYVVKNKLNTCEWVRKLDVILFSL